MIPTFEMAIAAGIKDYSYGNIKYYFGSIIITMPDGTKWRAIGHRPVNSHLKDFIQGYIEFKLL